MMDRKMYIYVMAVFLLAVLIALFSLGTEGELNLFTGEVESWIEGWTAKLPDGSKKLITLPRSLDVPAEEWVTIEQIIPEQFPSHTALRVRSFMQDVIVELDGETLMEYTHDRSGALNLSEASAWIIVSLPDEIQGKVLTLKYMTPVSIFSGDIGVIDYGHSDELKYEIIAKQPIRLLTALLIVIVGGLSLIISIIFVKHDNRFFYLGLFSVLTGIWLISEMDVMQFITGNRMIVGGISYIILPLIPICFTQYLKQFVLSRFSKIIDGLSITFLILFFLNIGCQLLGIMYFLEFALYVNIMIAVTVVVIIGLIIREYFVFKNPEALKYLLFLMVFCTGILLEIAAFFMRNFVSISSFSSVGFAVFFIFLIFDALRYINEVMITQGENKALRRMAYQDILTGSLNRASFEKAVDLLVDDPIRLIIVDMNRLKIINDTYGHQVGDKAIITFYECLKEAFGKYAKCYRMGGDEFALLMTDVSEEVYDICKEHLKMLIGYKNEDKIYKIDYAIGSDVYEQIPNYTFREFMHQVDIMMYEDKRKGN